MGYDQKAVERVALIERTLLKIGHPNQAQFIGIINAIELQVEEGDPVLPVVHHLAQALLELARHRGLESSQVSGLEKKLEKLQEFLRLRSGGIGIRQGR